MNNSRIQPIGERVLVKQEKAETKTKSGLIIPDSAQEKQPKAKVIAIGNEIKNININDTVLYSSFSGTEISHNGEKYLMLELSDILAKL